VISLLIRARYVTALAVLTALVLLAVYGRRVSYEQSIKSFFAEDDPVMAAYQRAARSFGDDNFIFVAYDDPGLFSAAGMDRVAALASALGPDRIDGVLRVESLDAMPLLWSIDDTLLAVARAPSALRGMMLNAARKAAKSLDLKNNAFSVGGATRAADRAGDVKALAALKQRVTRHPLFEGTVVDASGLTTAVVVRLKKTGEHHVQRTVREIRTRADALIVNAGLARPAVVGPPVLLADGFDSIERDGRLLAVVGMALIALVTLSAVRSLWWALVPIACGWVVWLATEATLASLNLKLALSGGPLVAQIIVLTMPAASHLAIHFRDDRRREADPRVAARSTLRAVAAPVLWCAVTGAIGYGALFTSAVMPVKQFGVILGTCTLLAALLVMALAPLAMLPPFPMERPVRFGSRSRVGATLTALTAWVVRHPAPVLAGVVAVVVPLSLGVARLRFESNYINAYKPHTRVVQDYRAVESRLGGIGLVELVVPLSGAGVDVPTLETFRKLDATIAGLRHNGEPAAAHVLSLATVLDPDGRVAALPAATAGTVLKAKLDLIAATPQAELLNSFWNPTGREARVLVRLREQQPAADKQALFHQALDAARAAFGPTTYLTGLSYLMTRTTEAVIVTQWQTFGYSALGIFLMLTLALRSPVMAALALLPTMLAVALVLGLMGWLDIKLDLATALVASVALGLSVDDTFHCLLQFRRERLTRPFAEALFAGYAVTGPGVLLSSLAVAVGFAALRLSEFTPFSNFGVMVCVATAGSTVGNLILLPACLALGQGFSDRRLRKSPEAFIAGA